MQVYRGELWKKGITLTESKTKAVTVTLDYEESQMNISLKLTLLFSARKKLMQSASQSLLTWQPRDCKADNVTDNSLSELLISNSTKYHKDKKKGGGKKSKFDSI